MTNYDIVKKLIGKIEPVGETTQDNERFENLKAMCELMDEIHTAIDDVAYRYKDRQEYSMKRASEFANKFLDKLGIKE